MKQAHKGQKTNGSPLLLLICASGICGCYLYVGKVQEQMFSKGSGSKAIQEVGSITTFMLVLSCITNVAVAKLWITASSLIWGDEKGKASSSNKTGKKERSLNHSLLVASKYFNFSRFLLCGNDIIAAVLLPFPAKNFTLMTTSTYNPL